MVQVIRTPGGPGERSREEKRRVQTTADGSGRLYQRDFVVVLEDSRTTPAQALRLIRGRFPELSPAELAAFSRPDGKEGLLEEGDTMHIRMAPVLHCGVIASQASPTSLTLRTLRGHLEAGRVSFWSYRDEAGRLVCRIRSRSRMMNLTRYLAYVLLGRHVQTRIWTTFLERLAARCGGKQLGPVLHFAEPVRESPADRGEVELPTHEEPGGHLHSVLD